MEAFPLVSERLGALGAPGSDIARVMKKHPNRALQRALNERTHWELHELFFSDQTYQPTYPYTYSHVPKSLGWKFTFCWTIRAEPRPTSKLLLADALPFATAFLIICAVWSGTDAQRIYTHSLQHHSEISPRRLFRPFCPSAPKRGPKIGVAHLVISRYLLSITAFCAVSSLLLTSVLSTGRYALKNFRLFSYFPDPVHLLTSENPAHFSRPILASQYTHSHYPIPPRLRNYAGKFSQLIRANQDLLLGLSVGRVTEYGGTTPPP